jgi:hypothetical protein
MTMAAALKVTRLVHRYSGLFFAPTILFFAITGGLQMFGLHETSRGNSYVPPAVLVRLSQLHKKGTLYLPPRRVTTAVANKPDLPKPPEGPPPLPAHNSAPDQDILRGDRPCTAGIDPYRHCDGWKFERRKSVVIIIPGGRNPFPGYSARVIDLAELSSCWNAKCSDVCDGFIIERGHTKQRIHMRRIPPARLKLWE